MIAILHWTVIYAVLIADVAALAASIRSLRTTTSRAAAQSAIASTAAVIANLGFVPFRAADGRWGWLVAGLVPVALFAGTAFLARLTAIRRREAERARKAQPPPVPDLDAMVEQIMRDSRTA